MPSSPLSVIIVDPSPVRNDRLASSMVGDTRVELLDKFGSLGEAYNVTEREQPDYVVISVDLVTAEEYPMYAAMLEILQVKQIIVARANDTRSAQVDPVHLVLPARIDEVGGLANLIADKAGLAPSTGPEQMPVANDANKLVVIGASTGGTEALSVVLATFPQNCPPTLIVQHIGEKFTAGLAKRLDRKTAPRVMIAEDRQKIQAGQVLVAPGNAAHLTVHSHGLHCRLDRSEPVSGHRPSVDALFNSVARHDRDVIAVLLTGMGRDGAQGMASIKNAGGWTIAQDQATSTVYGMPRAAIEMGAVDEELPLGKIGKAILAACQQQKGRQRYV